MAVLGVGAKPYKPSGKYEPKGLLVLPVAVALVTVLTVTIARIMLVHMIHLPRGSWTSTLVFAVVIMCSFLPSWIAIYAVHWCKMRSPGLNCSLVALSMGAAILIVYHFLPHSIFVVGAKNGPPAYIYNQSLFEQELPWVAAVWFSLVLLWAIGQVWLFSIQPFSERGNRWLPRIRLSKVAEFPDWDAAKKVLDGGIDCRYFLDAEPLDAKQRRQCTAIISLWLDKEMDGDHYISLLFRRRLRFAIGPSMHRVEPHRIGYDDAMTILERFGPAEKKRWRRGNGMGAPFAQIEL